MNPFKGKLLKLSEEKSKISSTYGHLVLPRGVSVFKETAGVVHLDIIPYTVSDPAHPDRDDELKVARPGDFWWRKPYYLHRGIGSDKASVVCLGKKCPICDYRKKLIAQGKAWDDELVKALKPSARRLYVVIPRRNADYQEQPHIWDTSEFLFERRLLEEVKANEEFETFPDLDDGHTLKIRFGEREYMGAKFYEVTRIDFIKRDKLPGDLARAVDLDKVLISMSPEKVESILMGADNEEEDEGEDEEESSSNVAVGEPPPPQSLEERDTPSELSSSKPQVKSGVCPHGHKFAEDYDKTPDCRSCKVWEECLEASLPF
ncbi:MAG: hypothetical protein QXT45_04700 [Candidatus Bilamarchaeaceae archaeon]